MKNRKLINSTIPKNSSPSSSSSFEKFLTKNSSFYYVTITILSTLIFGLVLKNTLFQTSNSKNQQHEKLMQTTTAEVNSEESAEEMNVVNLVVQTKPTSSARDLFNLANLLDSRDDEYIHNHNNNNNITIIQQIANGSIRIPNISPPTKCFKEFDFQFMTDSSSQQNSSSSSTLTPSQRRIRQRSLERHQLLSNYFIHMNNTAPTTASKVLASSFYRLIPRSDSIGSTETMLFQNISADECAARCFAFGPHWCTFFVRSLPSQVTQGRNFPNSRHVIFSDKKHFEYEHLSLLKKQRGHVKINSTNAAATTTTPSLRPILHPIQADNSFLFATIDEEEEARKPITIITAVARDASKVKSNIPSPLIDTSYGTCSLRVGILDPISDLTKFGIYVPAWVSEEKSMMMVPGELNSKTGEYENCESVNEKFPKQLASTKKRKLLSGAAPSSLLAIGLLAGAPYLKERVLPALTTWLKDEPNLVAFVDRKESSMRAIKSILPSSTKARISSSSINPLFACVHPQSLRGLYREFPKAGGDALYPAVVDEELTSIFVDDANTPQQRKQATRVKFCNPTPRNESDDNDHRSALFTYPGITYPIQTSSLFKEEQSNNQKSSFAAGTKNNESGAEQPQKGFVLFRFIREPDHQVLRLFNGAWKNYIILFELPIFYPTAFWYLTVDDDSMVLFRNLRYNLLLASLSNLHRRDDIYAGYLEYGDNFFFVHGGGGVVLSSGTMWKLHDKLPSCLPICRQAYGDVRVACCLHSMDIYERRLRFLFPFPLEKAPERWTNMLTSIHKYQTRQNIVTMWNTLENVEWKRKMKSVIMEEKKRTSGNVENQFRQEFFKVRRSLLGKQKNGIALNSTNELFLFDELLWAAESWRISKIPRKK